MNTQLKLRKQSKPRISILDFRFEWKCYGYYKVTYESPKTGKQWTVVTNDMPLIDKIKWENEPKVKHLNELKTLCKNLNKMIQY